MSGDWSERMVPSIVLVLLIRCSDTSGSTFFGSDHDTPDQQQCCEVEGSVGLARTRSHRLTDRAGSKQR